MARSKGRVIVDKIDKSGKRIKGSLAAWIAKHPGETYFDSAPEWEVWDYMVTHGIKHTYQQELLLFDTCETTEFKPTEIKMVKKKPAKVEAHIVKTKQRNIKFSPDYYLPEYDAYIEVKGYADEVFKLRWKLFKLKGYTGYLVYSLEEFVEVLKVLKESTKKQN